MTLPVLPDLEAAVLPFLTADTDVTAARTVGGIKGSIGWTVQAPYPCLQVHRAGGPDDLVRVARGTFQINAWGAPNDQTSETRQQLALLVRTAAAAMRWRLMGSTNHGAVISRVEVVTGLQWEPDDTAHQSRYFMRLLVVGHSA